MKVVGLGRALGFGLRATARTGSVPVFNSSTLLRLRAELKLSFTALAINLHRKRL